MIKRILLLSSLLVTSMTSHAGLIQYGDYKRDSASNIVTGGGLEWLKWDITKGMSINSAISAYASQGYRVASQNEVTALFQNFMFGRTDWTAFPSSRHESMMQPWDAGEGSAHKKFLELFGTTYRDSCSGGRVTSCYSVDDPYEMTVAMYFGGYADGGFGWVSIFDDVTFIAGNGEKTRYEHYASKSVTLHTDRDLYDEKTGVVLVRNRAPDNVAVPTPASIGLLALGLVALGYRRRHGLGR